MFTRFNMNDVMYLSDFAVQKISKDTIEKLKELIGDEEVESFLYLREEEFKMNKKRAIEHIAKELLRDNSSKFYMEYKLCNNERLRLIKLAKAEALMILENRVNLELSDADMVELDYREIQRIRDAQAQIDKQVKDRQTKNKDK